MGEGDASGFGRGFERIGSVRWRGGREQIVFVLSFGVGPGSWIRRGSVGQMVLEARCGGKSRCGVNVASG